MISKQLEHVLVSLTGRTLGEITQRFQKARDCSLLPKSRGEHAELLSNEQIAAAMLSLVPDRLGYAGLYGKALANLKPVGGPDASFQGAKTLGEAVAAAIAQPAPLLELRVLDGEFGMNAYGYAEMHHTNGVAQYVHGNHLSLMTKGAERGFDPHKEIRDFPIQRWVTFQASAFMTISRKVMDARQHQGDLGEFVPLAAQ
jgi:hypothetical protein